MNFEICKRNLHLKTKNFYLNLIRNLKVMRIIQIRHIFNLKRINSKQNLRKFPVLKKLLPNKEIVQN